MLRCEGIRAFPVLNKRVLIEPRMRIVELDHDHNTIIFPACWIHYSNLPGFMMD